MSDIRIETGLVDRVTSMIGDRDCFVVSDTNIWPLHGSRLGLDRDPILIAPGEASKSWAEAGRLVERLIAAGATRRSTVVAFGGGVVGDLAGFAASVLHRGCELIQVPTSLIAQVDSAIGGKTAVNLASGKNQAGTFHPADAVWIDPGLLATLPPRHFAAGLAEIMKVALLTGEAEVAALERTERTDMAPLVRAAVAAKLAFVDDDPEERSGRRALLNLGHSFGHAIETLTDYRVLHGEAVAVGLVLALGYGKIDPARVRNWLAAQSLPTSLGEVGVAGRASDLVATMSHDKKGGLVLLRAIGDAYLERDIDWDALARWLDTQP